MGWPGSLHVASARARLTRLEVYCTNQDEPSITRTERHVRDLALFSYDTMAMLQSRLQIPRPVLLGNLNPA